jgi:acyl-CoA dehydrogenase
MSSVAPTASERRAAVPPFTAAHEQLRGEIRAFVADRLRPHADEWEHAGWFPTEVFGWLAQAGYLGLMFPREYGGGDDPVAAAVLVCAVASTPDGGHQGISFLLIDRGDGVRASALRKLGWHASDTAEISLDDVFVPTERLLGTLHGGFRLIMANFQWERLLMALSAVAAMQACFDLTLDAVLAGGARGQATRHALAHVATEIEAGRAVTYAALRRHLAGQDAVREVTIAKLRTQRAAVDAIDACLQVLGLDAPSELERALRDARLGPIGGGTDEIMREILGRSLGL